MEINDLLKRVDHKNKNKGTTTMLFKRDLYDILLSENFVGDILEIGTNLGNTTAVLSEVARQKNKFLYSFDINDKNISIARNKLIKFGYTNFQIIKKDVYNEEWGLCNVGCVFIDCVHTEDAFASDMRNSVSVCNDNPIIFAHDYGLCESGIKSFIDKNEKKYAIVGFMGEKDNWNPNGTAKVCGYEGVRIRII